MFSVNDGNGGGSGAGTPVPTGEKERGKPGPKANPGGINAGLRALDRSGKPTRRWTKVRYPVHTISGYTFYTTAWVSPGTFPPYLGFRSVRVLTGVVAGDGLFEEGMKKGNRDRRNDEGGEGENTLEQDSIMANNGAIVA